ncbi:PREDICTED: uncharacterized protein LOC106820189 [Priapulus caudatus]|uniref:Uncharacterized protein LOC106820189 n=1 Tax=Priapulus caudatus TaxID=37621 RepID=A0ABM1F6Z6_PRICU|nr:PREDICTED: uncharacterized protein LOC106820189 [Priapulus caudatus]
MLASSLHSRPVHDNFQMSMLMRLEEVIENQKDMMRMLRVLASASRGVGNPDLQEDVLASQLDSVAEVATLEEKLRDGDFRKKMVNYLTSLCGHSCGDSVRRILRKLGSNNLWSHYSLKGRKGKLPLNILLLCKVMIKACIRAHKAREFEVEECIAKTLKHAPHKPGGAKNMNGVHVGTGADSARDTDSNLNSRQHTPEP